MASTVSAYGVMAKVRLLAKMFVLPSILWALSDSAANVSAATESSVVNEAETERCVSPVKVAVIGGGITGAATAAFLRKLETARHKVSQNAGPADATRQSACKRAFRIDVFEASDRLGGRLDFVMVPGGYVEMGGDTLDSSNKYMEEFINIYKADHNGKLRGPPGSAPGWIVWEAEKEVFNGHIIPRSSFASVLPLAVLAELVRISWTKLYEVFGRKSSGNMFDTFNSFQTNDVTLRTRKAFKSGIEMLKAVGLSHWVYRKLSTISQFLVLPSGLLPIEMIVYNVYTQSSSLLQTLAGLISLVCAFGTELQRTMPYRTVVEHLIGKFADNVYLNCSVEKVLQQVTATPAGTETQAHILEASSCASLTTRHLQDRKYDYVVIATPLLNNTLRIFRQTETRKAVELSVPSYEYQDVFVTVVHAAQFKKDATLVQNMSRVVATPEHSGTIGTFFVSSCGVIEQFVSSTVICKLKSGRELSDADLNELFDDIRLVERRHWKAYPYMHPFADTSPQGSKTYPTAATDFELAPGLFYPNAFEGLFSCMEGQAVAARNVAQLIMNSLESDS